MYFLEVADVGECNYTDYLVSRGIPIPAGWGVGQVAEGIKLILDQSGCKKISDDLPD